MASYADGALRGDQTADLQALVDSVPGLIHTGRADGHLDFFNQTWLRYVGRSLEDLEGWKWTAYIHPEDVDGIVEKWRASLASGEPFLHEARVLRADGEYRWMLHHKVAARTGSGEIVKWYGSSIDIEDRKQAEVQLRGRTEDLQRSEFYLAEGQRLAHMGNWVFDPAGFDYWSPELFRMHGLDPSRKPPTTREYLDCVHPQDRESMADHIKRLAAQGSPFDATKRIVRPDGEVRYIRCVGATVVENGSLKKCFGSAIDVTEHELLTQELRLREAYLAEAQRLSQTGSWAWSPEQDIRYWSEECYRVLSFDPQDGLPRFEDFVRRIHADDEPGFRKLVQAAIREKAEWKANYRIVHPDGLVRDIHVVGHPVLNTSGDLIEFVGTVIDVTERKQAEEERRRSEIELQQILDFAPWQVAVLGADGKAIYLNKAGLDYHGLTREAWRRYDPHRLIHPEDHDRILTGAGAAKLLSGEPFENEGRLLRKDGKYRWFLFRFNPLRDGEGRITRWYVTNADIEDRKKAEERLQNENVALREEIDKASMFEEIVGTSRPLKAVLSRIAKVAPTDSTVLITGETGTGKELIARAVHKRSQRSARPFVSVNCAALAPTLVSSELFGHEKGAFTGATRRRIGRFEMADGGTIFLDEVGELLPDTQAALLRVLQEREFERLGGDQPVQVDVRVIAATNRDLSVAVANGTFRQDLLYRLNVFPIEMPALRERKEDILILVEYFVQRYANRAGRNIQAIDQKTLELLQSYDWPGNIRELQNVIERSIILSSDDVFSVDESWLPKNTSSHVLRANSNDEPRSEREIIEAALADTKGRVSGPSGAAAKLRIPPSTLESRIRALKINKHQFKFG